MANVANVVNFIHPCLRFGSKLSHSMCLCFGFSSARFDLAVLHWNQDIKNEIIFVQEASQWEERERQGK